MKNLKVTVFDAGPSEIGVRISPSVQRHAIDWVALLTAPLYCHSVSNGCILYVSGHFGLPLLIDKDELIMIGVRIVISHPSIPRMICVLISLDAHVSDTSRCSHALNGVRSKIRALSVRLDHVDKGWDPSKVDDGIVVVDGNGGDIFRSGGGEGDNVGEELISPDLHSIVEQRVALPIA